MSVTFTVPEGLIQSGRFEYVGVSLLSTVFVLAGQSSLVSKWRKRAGIRYPQMYAEKAEAEASKDAFTFNCAQRWFPHICLRKCFSPDVDLGAHQNTLEKIPVVYVTTIITGLKYPIVAALGCGAWSLSRIFYTRGYLTQPEKVSFTVYLLRRVTQITVFQAPQSSQHYWYDQPYG
ncbi:hypothetical protein H0H92_003439 [Tricholoma furcatifolium]|nr:hypothetical protein H0H92_003439 [Tricholoma furcatifolium]